MSDIDKIIKERTEKYGSFEDIASLSQGLKYRMEQARKWHCLTPDKREALEMIQHKIARILNGDPEYKDSWDDIAGYAKLVADTLE